MLTSPVNVATALGGAPFKPHAAPSDPHARKEQPPHAQSMPSNPDMVIEPELPSNSPITSVNAVAATAGNRTILQELSLNVAAMLKVARRQDESLTSLFMRIIAAIEKMPQAERLQIEVHSGLKGLKITLADLAAALSKPDGPQAARLTAMAEAPSAVPGRTAAGAATSTYLQEGTVDGHAEETLAMRAAARSSAAGQNVFTAEGRARPADAHPADKMVLQDQLKTMFETGATKGLAAARQEAAETLAEVIAEAGEIEQQLAAHDAQDADAGRRTSSHGASERVAVSTSNLRLDAQALARIRTAAQAIADGQAQPLHGDREPPAAEKAEAVDRRPTMLTLKGLVEVVSTLPAKAVEILTTPPADMTAPLAAKAGGDADTVGTGMTVSDDEAPSDFAAAEEQAPERGADLDAAVEVPHEAQADEASALPVRPDAQAHADKTPSPGETEIRTPPRLDLAQQAVPFAYAPVPPAREEMETAAAEEEPRREQEDEAGDEGEDDREKRRPRDEYDAIHDPVPEDEPTIVINRDSSESDRAFALYQRMGGF